jgi:hypothetical protein
MMKSQKPSKPKPAPANPQNQKVAPKRPGKGSKGKA